MSSVQGIPQQVSDFNKTHVFHNRREWVKAWWPLSTSLLCVGPGLVQWLKQDAHHGNISHTFAYDIGWGLLHSGSICSTPQRTSPWRSFQQRSSTALVCLECDSERLCVNKVTGWCYRGFRDSVLSIQALADHYSVFGTCFLFLLKNMLYTIYMQLQRVAPHVTSL